MTITERCENWADCYRVRMRYSHATSLEGQWRPPQGEHWLFGSAPPSERLTVDVRDALEIDAAWQAISCPFHQFLLGAHYVRKWSPDKCVREAREFDRRQHHREPITDDEFAANIGMAHALLQEQLGLPIVFRRSRLSSRVHQSLDLDPWLAADSVAAADPAMSP